jgi:ribose transport system substrate-binding protein
LNRIVISLCVVSAVIGCGPATPKVVPKTYKIAYIPKDITNKSFLAGIDGANAKALELTTKGPDTITLAVSDNKGTVAADQLAALRKAIDDKVDGIIMSVSSESLIGPVIDEAVAAGIPVMTFDSDAKSSKRFTFYSLDDVQAATQAAQLALKLPKISGATSKEFVVISGVATAPNLVTRATAYNTVMTGAGWTSKGLYDGPDQTVPNVIARVEKSVTDNPNATLMMMTGTWPFRCTAVGTPTGCTAVFVDAMPKWKEKAANGSLVTVAINGTPEELQAMQQGLVQVVIGQKLWGWGYETVDMMYRHLAEKKEFAAFTDSGVNVICPNNVSEALAQWTSNNFSTALTKCTLLQ